MAKNRFPEVASLTQAVTDALSNVKALDAHRTALDKGLDGLHEEHERIRRAPALREEQVRKVIEVEVQAARYRLGDELVRLNRSRVDRSLIDLDAEVASARSSPPRMMSCRHFGPFGVSDPADVGKAEAERLHDMLLVTVPAFRDGLVQLLLEDWPPDASNAMPSAERARRLSELEQQLEAVKAEIDHLDQLVAEAGVVFD